MHFLGNSKVCPRVPKFWRWEQELPIWRFRQNKGASINGMWARCAKSSQSALVQFWIPPLYGGPRRILRSWKARNCRTSPPHIAHLCSPGVNEVSRLDKSLAKIAHLKIRFELRKKNWRPPSPSDYTIFGQTKGVFPKVILKLWLWLLKGCGRCLEVTLKFDIKSCIWI